MKIAKRTLAIVMAMLMVISTVAVAASAAGTLQSAIDAAAAGDTVTVNQVNAVESIVITKNITLDLNGHTLNSENGKNAIIVKGGATVTIKNGHVESRYDDYSGAEGFLKAIEKVGKAPAAIQAEGAGTKVILDGVRVVGSFFRVPRRADNYVPTGSALKLIGAEAELYGTMLTGSYGISGYSGAKVTIHDATLLGYLDAIRGTTVIYDEETVEKVNAADRIAGYLNSGITLENWELDLIKELMDDRAYIYTVKPTSDEAKVTIDKVEGTAIVEAEEIEHLYASSDCSYKYVPKFAYLANAGTRIALDTPVDLSLLEDDVVLVKYQLEFDLQSDIAKYIKNFYKYVDYAYSEGIKLADQGYSELLAKYEDALGELTDLYEQIEELGATEVFGEPIADYLVDGNGYNYYYAVMRDVIALGGAKMFNAVKDKANAEAGAEIYSHLHQNLFLYSPIYGEGAYAPAAAEYTTDANGYITSYGTLDKIDALVEAFKALKGNSSFADQTKWADYALFLVDNYETVLNDILPELETRVKALNTTLNSGDIGKVLDELGDSDLTYAKKLIGDAVKYLEEANDGVEKLFDIPYIADMKAQLEANRGDVAENVEKAIYVYNHKETYFTPEKYIDGNFVKAYYLDGDVQNYYVLHLDVEGDGKMSYIADEENPVETEITEATTITLKQGETLTFNAAADEGSYFLGWTVNGEDAGAETAFTAEDSYALVANFTPYYTVDITVDGNGSVAYNNDTTTTTASAQFADSITLTATAAAGNTFVGWIDTETSASLGTDAALTLTASQKVTAVFAALKTVEITVDGNGSVAYNDTTTTTTASAQFADSITLTATAAAGNVFVGWFDTDTNEALGTDAALTLTAAKNVTAKFAAQNTVDITVTGIGSVSYNETATNSTASVIFTDSIVLTAVETAGSGNTFIGWKVDGAYVSSALTLTVTETTAVEAVFGEGNLHLYIEGTGTIQYGGQTENLAYKVVAFDGSITLTAIPAEGYDFLYWQNVESGRIMSTNKTMVLETGLSRYIKAAFEKKSISSLILTSNSGTFIRKYDGTADQTSFALANATTPYIAGYDFKGWGPSGVTGGNFSVSGLTASGYNNGSSAFDAVGTLYNNAGYAFVLSTDVENKYLATPKFAAPSKTYSVMFHDPKGKTIGNSKMTFGSAVTYTAKGSGFAYWTNAAGDILCLNPTYRYVQVGLEDVHLYAVYGTSYAEAGVINIIKDFEEDGNVTMQVQRSVKSGKKVLSSGIVYSVDSEIAPTVENVDNVVVKKVVTNVNTNDGVHTVTLDWASLDAMGGDGTLTARAFVEIEGEDQPIYSDQIIEY